MAGVMARAVSIIARVPFQSPYFLDELQAIASRHADIRDHNHRPPLCELAQGLVDRRRGVNPRLAIRQESAEQLSGIVVVVDHKGLDATEARIFIVGAAQYPVELRASGADWKLDGERGPSARSVALGPDPPAVQLGHVRDDCQPQIKPALTAGG